MGSEYWPGNKQRHIIHIALLLVKTIEAVPGQTEEKGHWAPCRMEEVLSKPEEGRYQGSSGNSSSRNLWTFSLGYYHLADSNKPGSQPLCSKLPIPGIENLMGSTKAPSFPCSLCFLWVTGSRGIEMAFGLCLPLSVRIYSQRKVNSWGLGSYCDWLGIEKLNSRARMQSCQVLGLQISEFI